MKSESQEQPKIVVIGGGSGSANLLAGLRHHTSALTAIITTMDNGGSSGRIRQELDIPAIGDLRKAIIASSPSDRANDHLLRLMEHRFITDGDLHGHNIGNLILLASIQIGASFELGIAHLTQILGVSCKIIPVTTEPAHLHAKLEDGTTVVGEDAIDQRGPSNVRIRNIYLSPEVQANPKALKAIEDADLIVLSSGDFYTSLLPNLLVKGVTTAIGRSNGKIMYISNLVNKLGETDCFKLSDYLGILHSHLKTQKPLDAVVINEQESSGPVISSKLYDSIRIELDLEACQNLANLLLIRQVASQVDSTQHDPTAASKAIIEGLKQLEGTET